MASLKFCQKFLKNNKLSSDDAKKLYKSIQKLLKKNDHPSKSQIQNEVSSILPNKFAKLFANELFIEIESSSYQSDYGIYYDENYDDKRKKGGRDRAKEDKYYRKEKPKSKRDYEYDDDYEDDDDGYDDDDDGYDDYEIYYYYDESSDSNEVYSDSEISETNKKGKSDFNKRNQKDKKLERDRRNEKAKGNYQPNNRSSTEHVTTSRTMFARAYASSEYQRLSKDIEQKRVPLTHHTYDKTTKKDKKYQSLNGNERNNKNDESSKTDKITKSTENDDQTNKTESTRQRFVIYVAGLSTKVNTVSKIYRQFHSFGRILGIQVNRQELFALIEFNDLKSAYTAVNSKKPIFGNKLIKLGFASSVDNEMLENFRKKEEEIEKQSKEMKSDLIFIDEDKQSDFSYDESDDESYDMPDV